MLTDDHQEGLKGPSPLPRESSFSLDEKQVPAIFVSPLQRFALHIQVHIRKTAETITSYQGKNK